MGGGEAGDTPAPPAGALLHPRKGYVLGGAQRASRPPHRRPASRPHPRTDYKLWGGYPHTPRTPGRGSSQQPRKGYVLGSWDTLAPPEPPAGECPCTPAKVMYWGAGIASAQRVLADGEVPSNPVWCGALLCFTYMCYTQLHGCAEYKGVNRHCLPAIPRGTTSHPLGFQPAVCFHPEVAGMNSMGCKRSMGCTHG